MDRLYKMMNEGLGREKTVEDDVYDFYMQNKNVEQTPVKLTTFPKRRASMFDDLIKMVDKIPLDKGYVSLFKTTKVFNFSETVCYNIMELSNLSDDAGEAILTAFYNIPLSADMLGLPFPNTCIVTPDAAIVFHAVPTNKLAYMYTALIHMHGKKELQCFCNGILILPEDITKVSQMRVANEHYYVLKYNGKFIPFEPKQKYDSSIISPVLGKAMSLLMQLNTPDRFIMEINPVSSGVRSSKYIPKSHQRPEYVVLHPHVIRKYMKTESDVIGDKRRGHERRAHNRIIPNDPVRWPNAHGKVIRIQAVWIGQTESIIGDRQYKVIL